MVKLEESNSFFQSDEWKDYITTKINKKHGITNPFKKVGDYYCNPSKHKDYIQSGPMSYDNIEYTKCEWIPVGKPSKTKPFERELTQEEEELYNKYLEEERRKWKEKQPERDKNDTEEKRLRKEKEQILKTQKEKNNKFYNEQVIVYKKVGQKAVDKFKEARDDDENISVEEFLKTNYEITSGGKRRTTRKARKSKTNH